MLRFEYMAKTETKPILVYPRPEDILTTSEAELLQLADRGELLCPRCGTSLSGDKFVEEGVYVGIELACLESCGFREI